MCLNLSYYNLYKENNKKMKYNTMSFLKKPVVQHKK